MAGDCYFIMYVEWVHRVIFPHRDATAPRILRNSLPSSGSSAPVVPRCPPAPPPRKNPAAIAAHLRRTVGWGCRFPGLRTPMACSPRAIPARPPRGRPRSHGACVVPSKPRSGDAMIAPHRARQRAKVWGMWNCQFWASERSVNSISTRANLAYYTTSSRPGTYRIQPTPHHRSCLARCGAIIASPRRGLDPTSAGCIPNYGMVATRPALCGARKRSPEACLGVDGPPQQSGPRMGVGEYPHGQGRMGVLLMQN